MNKDDERRAFDLAYRAHDQWTIALGESPDFICLRHDQPLLGVEVTELWQHETDARLSNIGGYFDSLLDDEEVVHKDDRHRCCTAFPCLVVWRRRSAGYRGTRYPPNRSPSALAGG